MTDKSVAAVTAPQRSRMELCDDHPHAAGLILRVSATGRKSWLVRYRTDDGTQRRYQLGYYPEVGLASARQRAAAARSKAFDGGDPSGQRRIEKATAAALPLKTFDDLTEAYFAACASGEWRPRSKTKKPDTLKRERWLLDRYVTPKIGPLRLEEIRKPQIKALIRAPMEKGLHTTSNHVRAQLRQMFNFAISEDRLEFNPVTGVKAMGEQKPRERVLKDSEILAIWRGIDRPETLRKPDTAYRDGRVYVTPRVAIAIKLLMVTAQRRSEVTGMALSELDFEQRIWTIPGERTKNGRTHKVPLTDLAIRLIRQALALQASEGLAPSPFVFPSQWDVDEPLGANAVSHDLRNIRIALGLERLTPHDLRRTVATNMASERLRVQPFIIGRVLNHTTETGGAAMITLSTYALYDYMTEKRDALTRWSTLLASIVAVQPLAVANAPNTGSPVPNVYASELTPDAAHYLDLAGAG
ncbi:tyrosine-type recombinase/integrase [Brevundimonas sp.]